MLPVDLILLAIQAGVRLYSGMREAYVASIKQAPITLPLPRAPTGDDLGASLDFIAIATPPKDPSLRDSFTAQLKIVAPLRTAGQLTTEQQHLVRAFHDRWFPLLSDESERGTEMPIDPQQPSAEAMFSLLSVRQWAAGQPGAPPAAWQIAIGTLIDVAVFWFANDPGAIATNRAEGKALQAFLQSLEKIDFAHTALATVAADLMVAVLDTVASQPSQVAGGKREQALVAATTAAMAGALQNIPPITLDTLDTLHTEQLSAILQTVAAATLRAGVDIVLNDPKLFYVDTPDGPQTKVVEQVGKALADLALPIAVGGQAKIDLAVAVSPAGLETLARAALAAVGNNPAILHLEGGTETRLSPLLADLATSFSKAPLPVTAQAAFAEVAATVVQATDRHMDTLWPNNSNDPGQNLARGAVVATLDTLAAIGTGGGFSAFSRRDVVAVANAVIAAVADNPALMNIRSGGADPHLKAALIAILQSLKQQSVAILSGDDVVALLAAGLDAAVRKLPLLQSSGPGSSMVLGGVLDAAFDALAEIKQHGSDGAKWQAAGSKFVLVVIKTLLESARELPAGTEVTKDKLQALQTALTQFIANGKPLAALPQLVDATLG